MKHFLLVFIACLFFLYSSDVQAGNGSFLITKSTYLYSNPYKKEDKVLTKKRRAYEVVGIISLNHSLMFEILASLKNRAANGSGYILETNEELRNLSSKGVAEVNVYPIVPKSEKDLGNFVKLSYEQLSFNGMSQNSSAFPETTWRAVHYKAVVPSKYWVPEWAGVYRSDKDAEWMNQVYKELLRSNYNKKVKGKIIMGLVEVGFTKEQVTLTLGEPLQKLSAQDISRLNKDNQENAAEKTTAAKQVSLEKAAKPEKKAEGGEQVLEKQDRRESHWVYKNQKIIFKDGLVSRIL